MIAVQTLDKCGLQHLREFGHSTRETVRSRDGGIDAIVDDSSRGTVIVQVKHTKDKVGVEQFRELIGTMCIHGC